MTRYIMRFAAFLVLALTLGSFTATAQTPVAGGTPNIAEFDGIQAAVSRTYSIDFVSLAATPTVGTPVLPEGLIALSAVVMTFDTDANAEAAFDAFRESIGGELLIMGQTGTPTVTSEDLAELGDQAAAITLNTTFEDDETFFRFVLVREGSVVFLTSALGNTAEHAAAADDLASYVVNEGEAQGDQAIFVADGQSSGGLWGYLPPADHEVLRGLISVSDETLFPTP